MDSSSDLRQQRLSGLDSELLAGRFGPQFSRLVLHPQFSLQSIVFLPVALTAHVLFPMSGEDACEFRTLVADTFPKLSRSEKLSQVRPLVAFTDRYHDAPVWRLLALSCRPDQ
jgi:hypothetical protein